MDRNNNIVLSGQGIPLSNDIAGNLNVRSASAQFDYVVTAPRTNVFEVKSIYGLSVLRDNISTTLGGSITNNGTEYQVSTGTAASSTATLSSIQRGRYIAGTAGEAGLGVRLPIAPTGTQVVRWGYFDDHNGAFYGQDDTGIFLAIRSDGSDTIIRQNQWNADPLNGTGPSKYILTMARGNIFQIFYTWYGYGTIEFRVLMFNPNTFVQQVITVHRFRPNQQTSFQDPQLPLRVQVGNGPVSTTTLSVFVGGRQYSLQGNFNPQRRITSERKLTFNATTTLLPVISFRRKIDFPVAGRINSTPTKIEAIEITTSASILYELRLNPTLIGTNFGTPTNTTAAETALESDTSATSITSGTLIFAGLAAGSGTSDAKNSVLADQEGIDLYLDGISPVTIALQTVTGTATVNVVFRMLEEW